MPSLRWRSLGLFPKLGLFFLGLSLPALVLVEAAVVWVEFREFSAEVDGGAMMRAVASEGPSMSARVAAASRDRARLEDALAAWLLRLERPRDGLAPGAGYVLLELSAEPLRAAIIAADGEVLAAVPSSGDVPLVAPRELAAGVVHRVAEAQRPQFVRRYATRLGAAPDAPALVLELRVPDPWSRIAATNALEWPLMLGFLLLFAAASALFVAWYVTRRLHAIDLAAAAWARGDFARGIVDGSGDELGRLSARLNGMAAGLQELLDARTTLATLSERARLARDLHDTVKQKAFALSLQLAALKARMDAGTAIESTLVEARRLSEEIQRELAQVLDELRPAAGEGLAARIAARAHAFSRHSGIAMTLDVESGADVPPPFHDTLLRALDEALGNVLRHSHARRAEVVLRREGARFALEVRDDGRGVSGAPAAGHGLRNLRERAQALPDGRFAWRGEPDRGVVVRIDWDASLGSSA
jgi:signal transduction histidine kinase